MSTLPKNDAIVVRDFMVSKLITLSPEEDALEAIRKLLKNRISGAPVVDTDGTYLGVFSEKTSMKALTDAAYSQLPSNRVGAFMNTQLERTITEETDLLECMQIFLNTPFRRLPVLKEGKLIGQVSRRDVLCAAIKVIDAQQGHDGKYVMYFSALFDQENAPVKE
ncbi:MAG: CBS domain-containing protein [Pirellulaceae bacterium]